MSPLPTYQSLFGSDGYYTVPPDRSVFSPAAYLVQLLQLVDNEITVGTGGISLQTRRPDIYNLMLDNIQTDTMLPKLQIVNRVLANQVLANQASPSSLSSASYPFSLPYDQNLQATRQYLAQNKLSLQAIWQALLPESQQPPALTSPIALETLGISQAQWQQYSTSAVGSLYEYYGMPDPTDTANQTDTVVVAALGNLPTFLSQTGLNQAQVQELFYQDLSDTEIAEGKQNQFYINGYAGALLITITDQNIINLSSTNCDRIMRFVRLAQTIGWSFIDLDWALATYVRAFGSSTDPLLNTDQILPYLAWMQELKSKCRLSTNQCCAIYGQFKKYGTANGNSFIDSFFTINGVPAPPLNMPDWQITNPTDPTGVFLSQVLRVNKNDLIIIANLLYPSNSMPMSYENIGNLYQMSLLPQLTGHSIEQVLAACSILGISICNLVPGGNNGTGSPSNIGILRDFFSWLPGKPFNLGELQFIVTGTSYSLSIQNAIISTNVSKNFVTGLQTDLNNLLLTREAFSKAVKHDVLGLVVALAAAPQSPNAFKSSSDAVITECAKLTNFLHDKISGNNNSSIQCVYNSIVDTKNLNQLHQWFNAYFQSSENSIINALTNIVTTVQNTLISYEKTQQAVLVNHLAGIYSTSIPVSNAIFEWANVNIAGICPQNSTAPNLLSAIQSATASAGNAQVIGILQNLQRINLLFSSLKYTPAEINFISKCQFYAFPYNYQTIQFICALKALIIQFGDSQNVLINSIASIAQLEGDGWSAIAQMTNWDLQPDFQSIPLAQLISPVAAGNESFSDPGSVLQIILLLNKYFNIAKILNTSIADVLSIYDAAGNATQDYRLIAAPLWAGLQAQLQNSPNTLNAIQNVLSQKFRDKLVPCAIYSLFPYKSGNQAYNYTSDINGLYAYFLIDVEVSAVAQTTTIREAISAVQLFIYRVLNQLEPGISLEQGSNLPTLWQWMQNYRLWQANMEVFLYPEDYMEPALRLSKSDLFGTAQNALQQVDMTNPAQVESVFRTYMNGLETIGSLQITSCAGQSYSVRDVSGPEQFVQLCMIGQSSAGTGPNPYYFRLSAFEWDEVQGQHTPSDWGYWQKISVQMNTALPTQSSQTPQYGVPTPFFAFGRWYIFWVEQMQDGGGQNNNDGTTNPTTYTLSLKMTYLDFNGAPVPAQTLTVLSKQTTALANVAAATVGCSWAINQNLLLVASNSNVSGANSKGITSGYISYCFPAQNTVAPSSPNMSSQATLIITDNKNNWYISDNSGLYYFKYSAGGPQSFSFASNLSFNSGCFDSTQTLIYLGGTQGVSSLTPSSTTPITVTALSAAVNLLQYVYLQPPKDSSTPPNIDGSNYIVATNNSTLRIYSYGQTSTWQLSVDGPITAVGTDSWYKLGIVCSSTVYELDFSTTAPPQPGQITCPTSYQFPAIITCVACFDDGGIYYWFFGTENGLYGVLNDTLGSGNTYSFIASLRTDPSLLISSNEVIVAISSDSAPTSAPTTVIIGTNSNIYTYTLSSSLEENGFTKINTPSMAVTCIVYNSSSPTAGWYVGTENGLYFVSVSSGTWSISEVLPNLSISSINMDTSGNCFVVVGNQVFFNANNPNGNWDQITLPPSTAYYSSAQSNIGIPGSPGWFIASGNSNDQYLNVPTLANTTFNIYRLTSAAVPTLGTYLNMPNGVAQLLAVSAQQSPEPNFANLGPNQSYILTANYPISQIDFTNNSAMSPYYWELFFHLPFLIADALSTNQQFAAAKTWYETIFNPVKPNPNDSSNNQYWIFQGLVTDGNDPNLLLTAELAVSEMNGLYEDLANQQQLFASDQAPFDPFAIAQLRPIAYQKAIFMHYIDNLLAWGDMLFTQNTRDTINDAELWYVMAQNLLGTQPQDLGPEQLQTATSYSNFGTTGWVNLSTATLFDNADITCLLDDGEGVLYVGTSAGLYDNSSGIFAQSTGVPPTAQITCLATTNGVVIVGTQGDSFYWQPAVGGGFTQVSLLGDTTPSNVNCIEFDDDGNAYIGFQQNSLWCFTPQSNTLTLCWIPANPSGYVAITCLENCDGTIYAGTTGSAVWYGTLGSFQQATITNTENISCLAYIVGVVYVGTTDGNVWYVSGQNFVQASGCPGSSFQINCIAGFNGQIYLAASGTSSGQTGYLYTLSNGNIEQTAASGQFEFIQTDIWETFAYAGGKNCSLFYLSNLPDASWTEISAPGYCNVVEPIGDTFYFGSTSSGLWIGTGSNITQATSSSPLFTTVAVTSIAQSGGAMYVGTQANGLWWLPPYLGIPQNQQFLNYQGEIQQRLYDIRNSLTITGQPDNLPLFPPPINPMQLVEAVGSGENIAQAVAAPNMVLPYYRFDVMIEKAKEITAFVVQLGQSLLGALQTNDSQALAELYNTQQGNILAQTVQSKQDNVTAANNNVSALQAALQGATDRQTYYTNLIANGLIAAESSQVSQATAAIDVGIGISVLHGLSVPAYLLPNTYGLADGGMQFGGAVTAGASLLDSVVSILNQQSGLAGVNASFTRRVQDWGFQLQCAADDIKQINYQITAAQAQQDFAQQDLNLLQSNITNNSKIASFYLSKFTNDDLYSWYLGQLSSSYFQAFQLAQEVALQAQCAWQFESMGTICPDESSDATMASTFIQPGYWNSLYNGLLAGEKLQLDLQRMEKAYMQQNVRRFEIVKTISLAALDAPALVSLITTGTCYFNLAEADFAWDFPQHYCRKIKSLTVSLPMVLGPYQNIHATLTQTSSSVIVSYGPNGISAVQALLQDKTSSSTALQTNLVPNQQIVLSQGINDSGMFELNFGDPRYLPFEGSGAVSGWQLDLLPANNSINFNSITDVIIQLSYTALAANSNYLQAVNDNLPPFTGWEVISLANQSPGAWFDFTQNGTPFQFSLNAGGWNRVGAKGVTIPAGYLYLNFSESAPSPFTATLTIAGQESNPVTFSYPSSKSPHLALGIAENGQITLASNPCQATLSLSSSVVPPGLPDLQLYIQYQVQ